MCVGGARNANQQMTEVTLRKKLAKKIDTRDRTNAAIYCESGIQEPNRSEKPQETVKPQNVHDRYQSKGNPNENTVSMTVSTLQTA